MASIDFASQVAIVTGAGRGLGREYALEIARRGGRIVVSDIGGLGDVGGSWADAVVAEIKAAGGIAVASHNTVSTADGGAAIVETALRHFGRVDAIVHNAGFLRPAFVEDMTDAQLRDVLDVHLVGSFNVTRPAWRHMQQRGYGRIVLTSSSSIFGYPASSNYVAAKAGVLGVATALAQEGQGYGIHVNAILPFGISDIVVDNPPIGETPAATRAALAAMKARRHARSVAPLTAYLASTDCAVTGQAFSALAGRYARVALHVAEGWVGDPDTTEAEDIAAHIGEISDFGRAFHPASMFEEIDAVHADLQAKGLV